MVVAQVDAGREDGSQGGLMWRVFEETIQSLVFAHVFEEVFLTPSVAHGPAERSSSLGMRVLLVRKIGS